MKTFLKLKNGTPHCLRSKEKLACLLLLPQCTYYVLLCTSTYCCFYSYKLLASHKLPHKKGENACSLVFRSSCSLFLLSEKISVLASWQQIRAHHYDVFRQQTIRTVKMSPLASASSPQLRDDKVRISKSTDRYYFKVINLYLV